MPNCACRRNRPAKAEAPAEKGVVKDAEKVVGRAAATARAGKLSVEKAAGKAVAMVRAAKGPVRPSLPRVGVADPAPVDPVQGRPHANG